MPEAWVERPRLHQELNAGFSKPLTLVSASAGYGKTTLVSSWLEETELPHAWLSLDERDDDLIAFLTYFIAAVQTLFPKACPSTQALLKAPNPPPLQNLTHSLVNELDQIQSTFVLVLDDFHFILKSAIHDLLSEILRHPPRPLRLVLITRRDPYLPISKMRGSGFLSEIRTRALRFTVDETAALLQLFLDTAPEEAGATRLNEMTEGWVVGLRMVILSLRGPAALEHFFNRSPTRHHQAVYEYLMEEVLSAQTAATQEFLLKTSILDWLNPQLCAAVAGLDDSDPEQKVSLKKLREANLFIFPLEEMKDTYRYHDLFKGQLHERLKRRYPAAEVATLHARASRWYAQAGLVDEAVHHALAVGDADGAAQVIEQNRYATMATGSWPSLRRWLSQLPDVIVQQRPELLLSNAWVANYEGNYELIPSILQSLDVLIEKKDIDPAVQGEVDFFKGLLLFWDMQIEPSLELFRRAVERIPRAHIGLRYEPETYLATAGQMAGQGEEMTRLYQEKFQRETSNLNYKSYLLGSVAFISLIGGKLAIAHEAANKIENLLSDTRFNFGKGWGHYYHGFVHYAWNNLEVASEYFAKALTYRFFLDINAPIDSYIGLMLSYQAMGQTDRASETAREMVDFALNSNNPLHLILARSAEARLALAQGDVEWAVRWLETADIAYDAGPMFFFIDLPRMTRCQVLVARGTDAKRKTAEKELQEHWRLGEATHNSPRMIEIALLQARIRHMQGRVDDALERLEKAVLLGHPGGFIRPFLEGGPAIAELLDRLVERKVSVSYARKILAAFADMGILPRRRDPNQEMLDPLTNRELETLQLLASDLTIHEIADKLVVSVSTVRTHCKNIYSKLDVHSRKQAAQRARELGLV